MLKVSNEFIAIYIYLTYYPNIMNNDQMVQIDSHVNELLYSTIDLREYSCCIILLFLLFANFSYCILFLFLFYFLYLVLTLMF